MGVGWARYGGSVSVQFGGRSVEMSFSLLSSGVVVESSLSSKRDRSVFSCLSKVRSWRCISALVCAMFCSCSRISSFVGMAADVLIGVSSS